MATPASANASSCGEAGKDLVGGTYEVARSRFAFGSAPTPTPLGNGETRWVGSDGALLVSAFGSVLAVSDADSPARGRPDWSPDPTALSMHVRQYFATMGVPDCQMETQLLGSGGGGGPAGGPSPQVSYATTVSLNRVAAGIRVVESLAYAQMNDQDQTSQEGFLWPTLPASAIDEAIAFRDRLANPANLEAYKAKLPPEARGAGEVVIHHSSGASQSASLKVVVAWDTMMNRSPVSYDANGVKLPYGSW